MSGSAATSEQKAVLRLTDLSQRARFGCKGPAAAHWLRGYGFPLPAAANHWRVDPAGVLVARLGSSEFLVEAAADGSATVAAADRELASLASVSTGVYWVARQDRVLQLSGCPAAELLLECCSLNFRDLAGNAEPGAGPLVLTSMLGVAVLIVPESHADELCFTIWCDPSFGSYLSSCLLELVQARGHCAKIEVTGVCNE